MNLLRTPKSHEDTYKVHTRYWIKRSKHTFGGETYLMWLIRTNKGASVWRYLRKCSIGEIKKVDNEGRNVLMYACMYMPNIVVDLLNKRIVNINEIDNKGLSGFVYACRECTLYEIMDIFHNSHFIDNAITIACNYGRNDVVRELLKTSYPTTNDLVFACTNSNVDVFKLVFDKIKDIDRDFTLNGKSLLSTAAFNSDYKVTEFLLDKGFDDPSALHFACAHNKNAQVIKMLFHTYNDHMKTTDVDKLFERGMISILVYIYNNTNAEHQFLLDIYNLNLKKMCKRYEEDICPICLDEFNKQRIWLDCGHSYHLDCIIGCKEQMDDVQMKCPLCRAEF